VESDELLFILVHQVSELWFKLVLHELDQAIADLDHDRLLAACKRLSRCEIVFGQLSGIWQVLETMTPSDYRLFRSGLGQASGSQSFQFRAIEYALGYREPASPAWQAAPGAGQDLLARWHTRPSVYDRFIAALARAGYPIPAGEPERTATGVDSRIREVLDGVYRNPEQHWEVYETAEKLMDLEEAIQLWRFRHVRAVERTIGDLPGTGGTSGVGFLETTLRRRFFPEILAVRSTLYEDGNGQ
jgi:tryptophan 2,3-dioxygenase